MILEVKVVPGARKNLFKEESGGIKVYLTAPPVDGKANEALVCFLAKHYGIRSSCIEKKIVITSATGKI
ncbi:MAG: DUF167 domain-containing protein [Candidatus Omnitrophota bacterium]